MIIYCGNRAYWQWQRLTHPIVELLRRLVTITIHCDPWSGVRCLQPPRDRTKDYLIFTLYYALFNYTDCAGTKHSDAACEWDPAALELVNVTASMCFPSLTGAASVSHTALVSHCFRKLGFYMREGKKLESMGFSFSNAFLAWWIIAIVRVFTLLSFTLWNNFCMQNPLNFFRHLFCVSNFTKHHALIRLG